MRQCKYSFPFVSDLFYHLQGVPGIYTEIAKYMDWIETFTAAYGGMTKCPAQAMYYEPIGIFNCH